MPLTAGDKLGSYEILSPLGAGGMGEVYRARDTKLGREVAIKVLPARPEACQHQGRSRGTGKGARLRARQGLRRRSTEGELSQSPTLSRDATRAGVILGTAAYMSPEQAKGKTVDKRSDIFSFGVVLYEMLTGKRAFSGEDVSEVLAGIIKMEPDWKAVPSDVDPRIQNLLRRCFRKDRKKRLQAIGDVRVEIEDILAEPTATSEAVKARAPVLAWALAGVLAVTLLATLWILWPTESAPQPSVQLSVKLGAGDHQLAS